MIGAPGSNAREFKFVSEDSYTRDGTAHLAAARESWGKRGRSEPHFTLPSEEPSAGLGDMSACARATTDRGRPSGHGRAERGLAAGAAERDEALCAWQQRGLER